jgi:hypothetical protein
MITNCNYIRKSLNIEIISDLHKCTYILMENNKFLAKCDDKYFTIINSIFKF